MKSLVVFTFLFLTLVVYATAFDLRGQKHLLSGASGEEEKTIERITNGQNAAVNQFPYQVGLLLANGNFRCGGSLISPEWVLTAAHCTYDVASLIVQLGSNSRLNAPVKFVVDRSNIITHAEFTFAQLWHDIALIKIPPVQYTNAIQPIALPRMASAYPSYEGDIAIASGWGRFSDASNALPTYLQWADFRIISNTECARSHSIGAVYWGKICIATYKGISICNGDSGGPLVSTTSHVLIGVTSFVSSAGCQVNQPAAFTRVTSYLSWIQHYTGIAL